MARGIQAEADAEPDSERKERLRKFGRQSERKTALNNLLSIAASLEGIALSADQLDANDWVFGVENGVVDLRTGRLKAAQPADYLTKRGRVAFQAGATCPRWTQFISEIMDGNETLARYLQRAIGATMAGGNQDQALFILHGHGANGKSTFLKILQHLFGSYARSAENALFTVSRFQSPGGAREDIVRLKDARLVLTTELGEGEILNEDLVKRMTGGDSLAARVPYGKSSVEFQPKFTPWMATNHKPIIRGDDHAIWRRIQLVPFLRTFSATAQDKNLGEALRQELPGILNWAIQGCLAWQKDGLRPPTVVTEATREYRDEMDLLAEWLEEACVIGPNYQATTGELYQSYFFWCVSNSVFRKLDKRTFGRKLTAKGFKGTKIGGQRGVVGVGLKADASPIRRVA